MVVSGVTTRNACGKLRQPSPIPKLCQGKLGKLRRHTSGGKEVVPPSHDDVPVGQTTLFCFLSVFGRSPL